MKLLTQVMLASALSLAAILGIAEAQAHELRIGNIVIGHPWSRQSPMKADVAAGFLLITNEGAEDDRLVKATASISPNVQLHDMTFEGDVMKMVELTEGIPVPAGSTVELKPRSLHIMFMDIAEQPKEGDLFKAILTFEKAGTVEVEFEVLAHGSMTE